MNRVPIPLERWGATPGETAASFAGDELVSDPQLNATRAITVSSTPDALFGWLVQMGYGRGGWYSYDWIDNLGRPSADRILPQWQDLAPGDLVPGGPIDFRVELLDRPRAMVLSYIGHRVRFSLSYELLPIEVGGKRGRATRLRTRVRATLLIPGGRYISRYGLGIGDGIMARKQLLGLKARAEASDPGN